MGFNDEMDSYLRGRRRSKAFTFVNNQPTGGPSWWDRLWAPRREPLEDDYMPDEKAKLEAVERQMDVGEARLERAATPAQEQQFAAEQEDRVSFYHKLKGLFNKEHKLEDAYEELEHNEPTNVVISADVTDDFRSLASIQVRWFERMPTRIRDEFRESEDYAKYVEILQRRGVAKKK